MYYEGFIRFKSVEDQIRFVESLPTTVDSLEMTPFAKVRPFTYRITFSLEDIYFDELELLQYDHYIQEKQSDMRYYNEDYLDLMEAFIFERIQFELNSLHSNPMNMLEKLKQWCENARL